MINDIIPNLNSNPLNYVLDNNLIEDGTWLEFGVFNGRTINLISKYTDSLVYGFDTFSGLPESWKVSDELNIKKGFYSYKDFAKENGLNDDLPLVNENVRLIVGLFSDSLPKFIKNQEITFIHVDCDTYNSTKDIFNFCTNNIKNNCIIVFDELINYPNYHEHEFKAFVEWVDGNGIEFQYLGMNGTLNHTPKNTDNKEQQKVAIRIINNPKYNI
jgi:hypothetical protein